MTSSTPKSDMPDRLFPSAREDAHVAKQPTAIPQTEHSAYKLAFQDDEFLLRDELRPVRLQLELLKAEMALTEAGIRSTLVVYGSARIPAPEHAEAVRAAATSPQEKRIAERLVAKSHYYTVARELARLASEDVGDGHPALTICSGGGPSIMEAANRGAYDEGRKSIGLNIVLPHEQLPNPYVTPGLSFQFHYFALRKMHFLMRAKAVAAFPGGFGTLDELLEVLTLVQTGKVRPLPILLYGREFWNRVINFDVLVEEGVIAPHDLDLFRFVETAEQGWAYIKAYYSSGPLDD